jgi:zinc transport system substrate-binding protein
MRLLPSAILLSAVLFPAPAHAEVPRVVATIKPVHSLVAAVMGDLGTPELIVKGAASVHAYSLRPSDAEALEAADLVVWTGPGLELFLSDAIGALAGKAQVLELATVAGLELLPVREGGAFELHEDEAGHDEVDMHFWLDPVNAARLASAIAEALAAADPEHALAYRANAAAHGDDLAALTAALETSLAGVRDKPFIVFHDAYQYFEQRFGLSVAGSVTVTPDTMPGARRVAELRERIAQSGVGCVFAEPQFEPAIVAAIIEGTGAQAGELDPLGAGLVEGAGLYRQLLEDLAAGLVACLGGP